MARLVRARVSSALAVAAVAFALIRSIAAVWFTSEVIATPPTSEIAAPALADRVLLVVVDGLRYDTALESGLMPHLQALARDGSAGLSMATQVTMTGLGVRTLGTGTTPALADILLESKLPAVTFDNVFASVRRRGGHVAWLGNPSWKELFGDSIDIDAKIERELDMLARADNVWAADRVIVRRAARLVAKGDWQLAVVHIGGLDNASHRFTPFGAEFQRKARATDDDLARLVAAATSGTAIIITSDHGTSDRGHHGSGETITRRTPLVFTGTAIARHHTLDARQTDVAPTIAALLGLPIPAPSEGQILLDALDAPPATLDALRAANLRQLDRYASAYASAHDLDPPHLDATPDGMRRLGDWIEDTRERASIVPLVWALALGLIALVLFGAPTTIAPAIAAVAAAWTGAGDGRSLAPAVIALAAASVAAVFALRDLPRRRIAVGAIVLVAIEAAMIAWKLNHRFVEMKMHDIYGVFAISDAAFQRAMTAVAGIVAVVVARRWWPASRWSVIAVVVVASALADSLAIPAAIAGGMAAATVGANRRERIAIAVAALAGIAGFALVDVDSRVFDIAAPLALAALGVIVVTDPRSRVTIAVLGVAAVAVRVADNPAIPYRLTLAAIAVAAVVLRGEVLGWGGAIALAMLSRSGQLPGLVAWTAFAGLAGRVRRDGDLLAPTLIAIGFRFACFALFEGVFEFSHLEVWLAYEGNPGAEVAFGAAIIAIKLALPLVVGLALATTNLAPASRRTVVAWTAAFLCLRIAHIAMSMTVARGTFYSPYLDSGQLVFTYLMLASVPIVLALVATRDLVTRRRRDAKSTRIPRA
jgi:hypothetical protein